MMNASTGTSDKTRTGELMEKLRSTLHDLNNALTPVMANAQLMRFSVEESSGELVEALDDVVESSARANALVADLRHIARSLDDALHAEDGDARSAKEESHG